MKIAYIPFMSCPLCFSQLRPIDISIDWPCDHMHWSDVEEPHIWVTLECRCYHTNMAIEYVARDDGYLYPMAGE